MPSIAIVSQDGTIAEVVVGDTVDIPAFSQRFPDTQSVVVPDGVFPSKGWKYSDGNFIAPVIVAPPSRKVEF